MQHAIRALALAAAVACAAPAGAADDPSCETIRLSDPGWTDITSTNAIASVLLEALGYAPEVKTLSVPIGYEAMKAGEIDVFLGNWMPAQAKFREDLDAAQAAEVLGQNLTGAKFTLAVPSYVAEAGVTDFKDLAAHPDEFGKEIYGIETGAPANSNILRMIEADDFGLDGWEVVESGEQAMLAQVARAEKGEDWIVFLAWAPHPMNNAFDITYLAGGDAYFGPDFGGAEVYTLARTGWSAACPNAAQFFKNLVFDIELENAMMGMILDGEAPDDAAETWIEENPGALDAWLAGVTTFDGQPGLDAAKAALDLLTPLAPNFLILMVDQLAGTFFPDGPAAFLHAPNLKRLAARSARFANAYAASPLCAPARASFMSGLLPSRTRVYDNAAEFPSDTPTFAHHLRLAGYFTCLAGKMHFVGPDQLHGFEERLTTDIYPADFGWTPDYTDPDARIDWWYHSLGSVTGAGVAEITNQLDYDDEVAYHATAKLYDLARRRDARPWCLTVSFTHPHDPYVARQRFWDLYEDCAALEPAVAPIPFADQDPHSRRLMAASDHTAFAIRPEHVRRARRGYFANISYLDERIGELLDVLRRGGMADETAVVFLADHGDMLGERGLWFKMSFFEGSARVPLMIAAPGLPAGRIDTPVSALDVAPTLAALAGIAPAPALPADGASLLDPAARGPVPMEYAAEGSRAPLVALRDGRFKLILCEADPPLLFDLAADPHELANLAPDPGHAAVLADLTAKAWARWDLARFDAEVRASQARRRLVYEALRNGAYYPWDHQPLQRASERYMRNHMDLDTLESARRFPPEGSPP